MHWDNSWLNEEVLEEICMCLGPIKISNVIQEIIKDSKAWKSGHPDLLLFNRRTKELKLVEVKSKGDVISLKQRCWMALLKRNGIICYVCKVIEV